METNLMLSTIQENTISLYSLPGIVTLGLVAYWDSKGVTTPLAGSAGDSVTLHRHSKHQINIRVFTQLSLDIFVQS